MNQAQYMSHLPELPLIQGIKPSLVSEPSVISDSLQDQVLQQHYQRMQETLLQSVDKEIAEMNQHLKQITNELENTNVDKTAIGVALYQANTKIGKMNSQLNSYQSQINNTQNELELQKRQNGSMSRQVSEMVHDVNEKQAELEQTRRYLEETHLKINQLGDVNTSFTSDLKIQRRIQTKLKKELEISESKRKQAETGLEEEKKKNEDLHRQIKEMALTNDDQKKETLIAQKAVDKMNREIALLATSKKTMEKQWEESIAAMAKRDQSLQSVIDTKEKIETQWNENQVSLRVLKTQKNEAEAKLREKDLECQNLMKSCSILRERLNNAEQDLIHYKNDLNQAHASASLMNQEIQDKSKDINKAQSDLQAKSIQLVNFRAKLEDFKDKLTANAREKDSLEKSITISEQEKEKQEASKRSIQRIEDANNALIRNEHENLKFKNRDQLDELNNAIREKDAFQKEAHEINKHYLKLYDEWKYLLYTLERKQHDINYLTSKLQVTGKDSESFQDIQQQKIQTELVNAKAEYEKIQKMWMDERQDNLKLKQDLKKLHSEKEFLETQYKITDAIKLKTIDEITETRKEATEDKLENSKLLIQLRKMQPIMDEFQKKNVFLENQIQESRILLQESNLNATTSSHMLKTEIRRLYQDKLDSKKKSIVSDKSTLYLERKYTVAKEMVEKLTIEKKKLLTANYELKRKSDEFEVKYNETKYRLSVEKMRLPAPVPPNGIQRINGTSTPYSQHTHSWESLAYSGYSKDKPSEPNPSMVTGAKASTEAAATDKPQISYDIPDFESWRLKIDSLTKERQYLENENNLLKTRLEEISLKIVQLEKKLGDIQGKKDKLQSEVDIKRSELEESNKKYNRAEKIAAHLEKQFKEYRPNTKIDYFLLNEAEPSTQLLAALMAQAPPSKIERPSIVALPTLGKRTSMRRSTLGSLK